MIDDKRMYFVRNIEDLKNENVESFLMEYEVTTDAEILGAFIYGPYYFTIWEFSFNKREGEERKLCLRIRERKFSSDKPAWKSATKSGFYHGGDIADELIALASVFLRRRLKRGPIVRMEDRPTMLPTNPRWVDKAIVAGKSNIGDLPTWLKLVEGLDNNYHQRFILAVRLYHQALCLIEEQPDIAYLNLVSAIEVLCRETDIGKVNLSDLDKGLTKLVDSVENEDLRNKIKQAILKRERFISRRFVAFILSHIEESFWSEEKGPEHGQIKLKELSGLLSRIYNQRSNTLHNGEPFPPNIFRPPMRGEEKVSFGVIAREKKWDIKDLVPNPHFFERLVNHVLKTFIKKNQSRRKDSGKLSPNV